MGDYVADVLDGLLRNIAGLPTTGHVLMDVRVPAQIAAYQPDLVRNVFQVSAAQNNVAVSRLMTATYDQYELKGSRESVRRVLQLLRDDLTEVGSYSTPVIGYFLRARGIPDFINFAADRSGVSCYFNQPNYLEAYGKLYRLADFVYMLKEMERKSKGALPLFDARQKAIDRAARDAAKTRRIEERRERRQHQPILKYFVRNRDTKTAGESGVSL